MKLKFFGLWAFLLCWSFAAIAQEATVTGTVLAADDGSPLPGVNVVLKGTAIGAATNIDGFYSVRLPKMEGTLVFSMIGYKETEVVLTPGSTVVDLKMEVIASLLEEIVVIGYGAQKKSEITGAVATVNAESFNNTPMLRAEQAIQGRTAGVQVAQNSGSPGSALSVRIRGIGTITNSEPLYIVDGVPVGGIDFLSPSDIESVTVLKDAASAAIYGARAANGVVLITTKQGKKGQEAVISYDAYFGVQNTWKKMNLLNAKEYAIISNESRRAAGLPTLPEFADPASLGEGTDWQSAIFEKAPIQSHQISIVGGSATSSYAIAGGYFAQEGIVGGKKADFQRYNLRLNANHELSDKLSVGHTLSFTRFKRNALPENNEFTTPLVRALNMDPITTIYKADGTFNFSKYSDTDITNPVNAIALTNSTWSNDRVVGSVFAEYKIANGLKFRSSYSMDISYATLDDFSPTYNLGSANEQRLVNGVSKQEMRWNTWLSENMLTYDRRFNDKHHFTALAGITAQAQRFTYLGGSASNLPSNNAKDAYIAMSTSVASQRTWGGANEWSLLSYVSRVNYEYNEKYLFSASFRADGSSRFGANNRFGYFPSLSAGWVMSSEDFFPKNTPISFAKLRASWGQNGNQEIGLYGFTSSITSGLTYTFGSNDVITNGSAPITASNPDLKWETSTQTDIGLDVEMFKGKITFTADYYTKKTSDMLVVIPIPMHVGSRPPISNAGTVLNKGLEMALAFDNSIGKLSYNISGNISFMSNKLTSLGRGGDPINSGFLQSANSTVARTDVGHPIGSFYGYVTDGLFQNQGEVEAGNQPNASPGDIRFKDLNNDGKIDENDRTYIGNPTPKFIYGITASAKYMGFDASVFLQGSQGNDLYNGITRYDFDYVNRPNTVLNRWTGEGSSNFEPRVVVGDPNQNARVSSRFVEKGSYMRIKNAQIGYTLPKTLTKKANLDKVRVYVGAQNLFTFTKYKGLDPEIGTRGTLEIGIDRGFYPQARTIMGGLNISF